uniref:Uncharacterized protein n=1 Tax=Craspedostauros australis TaxID=1486917 RepID=A0A7R9ZIS7_9STRA
MIKDPFYCAIGTLNMGSILAPSHSLFFRANTQRCDASWTFTSAWSSFLPKRSTGRSRFRAAHWCGAIHAHIHVIAERLLGALARFRAHVNLWRSAEEVRLP